MGKLTTHVLDTAHGRPAGGILITLYRGGSRGETLAQTRTNSDGRSDAPLLQGADLRAGVYDLVFAVGDYYRELGLTLPDPPFLDEVSLSFGVADPQQNYHVPLLMSPWSYSTYRGS
ncbi:MAG: hydroxyisourate hydrolase [Hydrocarboniphaga sp.]|uniref:hydroxyisourate hydrolase n=1 Tax=Hydrocarboniphaga sp. TaxID=2033016 RepID=UPI0026311F9E|nr:hydroxyisourate hydrolase [Hydrocarboniphaga sp.]MDB5971560.1 hydroxyisourate hydrolase [Hydrocarboniphaga sp.]